MVPHESMNTADEIYAPDMPALMPLASPYPGEDGRQGRVPFPFLAFDDGDDEEDDIDEEDSFEDMEDDFEDDFDDDDFDDEDDDYEDEDEDYDDFDDEDGDFDDFDE